MHHLRKGKKRKFDIHGGNPLSPGERDLKCLLDQRWVREKKLEFGGGNRTVGVEIPNETEKERKK